MTTDGARLGEVLYLPAHAATHQYTTPPTRATAACEVRVSGTWLAAAMVATAVGLGQWVRVMVMSPRSGSTVCRYIYLDKPLDVCQYVCQDTHMTTKTEIHFTAKRALYWNAGNRRWQTIGREKAEALIATGQAVELKAGEWI